MGRLVGNNMDSWHIPLFANMVYIIFEAHDRLIEEVRNSLYATPYHLL